MQRVVPVVVLALAVVATNVAVLSADTTRVSKQLQPCLNNGFVCVPKTKKKMFLIVVTSSCTQVKVTLFYEHLCPDSIRWVSNQLAPNYDALRNVMDIEFIPFGKSRVS